MEIDTDPSKIQQALVRWAILLMLKSDLHKTDLFASGKYVRRCFRAVASSTSASLKICCSTLRIFQRLKPQIR